jgi:hypothetical protein
MQANAVTNRLAQLASADALPGSRSLYIGVVGQIMAQNNGPDRSCLRGR